MLVSPFRRWARAAQAALVAVGIAACGGGGEDTRGLELARVSIGSNPPGTSYYAVGGGIAKLIQEAYGTQAIVRPFAGSSVYLPLIQRGELPLGLNTGIDSHFAYSGEEVYGASMPDLRLVIQLWPIKHSYLVRASSDMRSIDDLRGRRVVTDLSANAFLGPYHRAILATAGLTESDVQAINTGGLPDGLRLLTQGRADATPAAIDLALVRQAHTTIGGGVRYLSLGTADTNAPERVPGASVELAEPTAVTTGFDAPMLLPQFHTLLNASVHLAESDAYAIAALVYENWEGLQADFPVLAQTPRERLVPENVPIPYHPGAIAYYRDAGIWTDAHEANQRRLLGL